MVTRAERKRWNAIDWDFIIKLIAIFVCSIALIFGFFTALVWAYREIRTAGQELMDAKIVNDEMRRLYKLGDQIGEVLIREQDMERIKTRYDYISLGLQQKCVELAYTKLSKKQLPYGTMVYLEETCKAVKVNSHDGLDIGTVEGIHFLLTDENYHTISQNEYNLCKRVERGDME